MHTQDSSVAYAVSFFAFVISNNNSFSCYRTEEGQAKRRPVPHVLVPYWLASLVLQCWLPVTGPIAHKHSRLTDMKSEPLLHTSTSVFHDIKMCICNVVFQTAYKITIKWWVQVRPTLVVKTEDIYLPMYGTCMCTLYFSIQVYAFSALFVHDQTQHLSWQKHRDIETSSCNTIEIVVQGIGNVWEEWNFVVSSSSFWNNSANITTTCVCENVATRSKLEPAYLSLCLHWC